MINCYVLSVLIIYIYLEIYCYAYIKPKYKLSYLIPKNVDSFNPIRNCISYLSNDDNESSKGNDDNYGRPNIVPFDFAKEDVKVKTKAENKSNESGNKESKKSVDTYGRPNIVPFDFAREDIVIKPKLEKENKPVESNKKEENNNDNYLNRQTELDPDSMRPTGYANDDDDDDNNINVPSPYDDNPLIIKILKDIYIGSPYDSPKRKEARSVVRNITGLSLGIGIIFTIVWYAFPGQFISYRGDRDFIVRYQPKLDLPDDLLNDDSNTISPEDWDYFQDGNTQSINL